MSSVARTYVFLLLLVSFVIASVEAQRLWCHGGGADREYSPIQCPDETIECFKFVCKNAQTGQVCEMQELRIGASKDLPKEKCSHATFTCLLLSKTSYKKKANKSPLGLSLEQTYLVNKIKSSGSKKMTKPRKAIQLDTQIKMKAAAAKLVFGSPRATNIAPTHWTNLGTE
ncbi:hypothetical protein L596_002880 [Steinernema carpocapsae]|uniref:Secreted protein n=1 Tax=Steinernema carpocapsae TaxID=34508 RepID=A0A4U8UQU5_STECR|nr:hypothetical protein L596_002880 [Steinernema carpocapsae]